MQALITALIVAAACAGSASAAEKTKTNDRRSMCEKDWATASAKGATSGKPKELYVTSCLMGDPKPTQAPRPKGVSGTCNDGTNSAELNREKACAGHGGVATWLLDPAAKG